LSADAIREFVDNAADPQVRGYLHLPATPNNDACPPHGAGSNAPAPLIALAETFRRWITVLRCDLPLPPVLFVRSSGSWQDAARIAPDSERTCRNQEDDLRLLLGGYSYGGRQSSMLCAEELTWFQASSRCLTRRILRAN
jgi:predicted alpha/beta-hydrolase family hydrolase